MSMERKPGVRTIVLIVALLSAIASAFVVWRAHRAIRCASPCGIIFDKDGAARVVPYREIEP